MLINISIAYLHIFTFDVVFLNIFKLFLKGLDSNYNKTTMPLASNQAFRAFLRMQKGTPLQKNRGGAKRPWGRNIFDGPCSKDFVPLSVESWEFVRDPFKNLRAT